MSTPQTIPQSAAEQLEREFLQIRARILELAAALDRLQRAEQATGDAGPAVRLADDARMALIGQGLAALAQDTPDRAERVQLLFSRPYDPRWQAALRREG